MPRSGTPARSPRRPVRAFALVVAMSFVAVGALQAASIVDVANHPMLAGLRPAPPTDTVGSTPVGPAVPTPVVERARHAVAVRWGVEQDRVALEFAPLPRGTTVAEAAAVELLGTGAGGWWVASFTVDGATTGRVRVRAGVTTPTAVAARALARGDTLTSGDLRVEETVVWGPPEEPVRARPGWAVRSAIREGTPLRPPAVEPPLLIRSGEPTEVVIRRGPIALTVEGVALGSARDGERVRVRATTGRLLRGVAVGPGRIRADGHR